MSYYEMERHYKAKIAEPPYAISHSLHSCFRCAISTDAENDNRKQVADLKLTKIYNEYI